jgi:hypothetical protein
MNNLDPDMASENGPLLSYVNSGSRGSIMLSPSDETDG